MIRGSQPSGTWEVARGDAEKKIWILICDFGVFFGLFVRKMYEKSWMGGRKAWVGGRNSYLLI